MSSNIKHREAHSNWAQVPSEIYACHGPSRPRSRSEIESRGLLGKSLLGVERCSEHFSVKLVPLHPGIDDEALGSYFAVEVPDSETAKTVVRYLRPCRGIRAAYVKPADALPKL